MTDDEFRELVRLAWREYRDARAFRGDLCDDDDPPDEWVARELGFAARSSCDLLKTLSDLDARNRVRRAKYEARIRDAKPPRRKPRATKREDRAADGCELCGTGTSLCPKCRANPANADYVVPHREELLIDEAGEIESCFAPAVVTGDDNGVPCPADLEAARLADANVGPVARRVLDYGWTGAATATEMRAQLGLDLHPNKLSAQLRRDCAALRAVGVRVRFKPGKQRTIEIFKVEADRDA